MLSRVADSLYWMNRYVERAEDYARFVDVNLNLMLEMPPGLSEQWSPLVMTTGDEKLFKNKYNEYSRKNVIQFLAFDKDNPNSIYSCIFNARELARSVREVISSETWIQINKLYIFVKDGTSKRHWNEDNLHEFFSEIITGSHTVFGTSDVTSSHDEGWHFGNLGRLLERADKTSRIIDVKYFIILPSVKHVGTTIDLMLWSALLNSASAYEMYRKTYGGLDVESIVRLLMLSPIFPRAMHYCLIQSERSLHAITGKELFSFATDAEKELGKLKSSMDYMDVNDIFKIGIHKYLDTFQTSLNKVGAALEETFFDLNLKKKPKILRD